MQTLGELAEEAKADNDAVRAACVQDKLERGQAVMEVATGELMVVRDSGSTSQQKAFAIEKLQEASARLGRIVGEARVCRGELGPEDEDDVTRNEVDEPVTVPIADPTQVGGDPPVPPPVDDHRPPTVASPSE